MGIISSIIAIILGIVLVIWPAVVAQSIVQILGILLIAAGVISLFSFLKSKSSLLLASIILEVLIGIVFLSAPVFILKYLFIVMGILLVAAGIGEIVRLVKMSYGLKASWKLFLLPAIVTACGLFLVFCPKTSTSLVVIYFGVALIIYGISELITAIKLR